MCAYEKEMMQWLWSSFRENQKNQKNVSFPDLLACFSHKWVWKFVFEENFTFFSVAGSRKNDYWFGSCRSYYIFGFFFCLLTTWCQLLIDSKTYVTLCLKIVRNILLAENANNAIFVNHIALNLRVLVMFWITQTNFYGGSRNLEFACFSPVLNHENKLYGWWIQQPRVCAF